MSHRITAAAALLAVVAALGAATRADVPNPKPGQLRGKASHVVTGKVTAVYTRERKGDDFHDTEGVVEVAVTGVEKGDGVKPGDAVYARFHTRRWVGAGRPRQTTSAGHVVPGQDEQVRVYLARKAGRYDALLPNGFEPLKKPGAPKATQ